MEPNNTKVLAALQMQPLSEEEKASRHILGRLWGPIATTKEKTRNGRGYNAELWQKALADEIFLEKVANKSLFLELGHPVDREETDMRMVCACIPELPKVIDGDLYAYVDILDTKDGQLLKTLCDYGFVPGISSRGSGDIMTDGDVDPETFFLETWDIVQLPAVKKARLSIVESMKKDNNKLYKALCESLDQMTEEDRKTAEATLERLGVFDAEDDPRPDIPWVEEEDNILLETTEEIDAVAEPADSKHTLEEAEEAEDAEDEAEDISEVEEEDISEEDEDDLEEPAENAEDEDEDLTVKTLIANLSELDETLTVEFDPIEIDDQEITITELVLNDDEEGKVKISFNYNLETSDNTEDDESSKEVEAEDEEQSSSDDEQPEAEDASEEATDDGDDEVIESLKEMVRQKNALEEEVLSLKNRQAVRDAEVTRLQEEVTKYKTGFMRVSELASKSTKLQKEITSLNEQLAAKNETIHSFEQKAKVKLNESVVKTNKEITTLQERLARVQNEAEATEQALREQVDTARENTRKATTAAKAYKQKYVAVVEHYIASKATMLGVSTRDITSKLHEGYTLEDVDHICETLLDAGRPAFSLGHGVQGTPKVKLSESAHRKQSFDGGYEIDDDLLVLAGLK